jgi:hypothetical protein
MHCGCIHDEAEHSREVVATGVQGLGAKKHFHPLASDGHQAQIDNWGTELGITPNVETEARQGHVLVRVGLGGGPSCPGPSTPQA